MLRAGLREVVVSQEDVVRAETERLVRVAESSGDSRFMALATAAQDPKVAEELVERLEHHDVYLGAQVGPAPEGGGAFVVDFVFRRSAEADYFSLLPRSFRAIVDTRAGEVRSVASFVTIESGRDMIRPARDFVMADLFDEPVIDSLQPMVGYLDGQGGKYWA
jgi:hypothetical protein